MTRRLALAAGLTVLWTVAAACSNDGPRLVDEVPKGPVVVTVDATDRLGPISPLIRGISGDWSAEQMEAAGIRVGSWGGNPSTRFNYRIGHAWNSAADWQFRNTSYGNSGDAFREFAATNAAAGAETRLAVPTLGWVAKDSDHETCSFPDGSQGCATPTKRCDGDGPIADPRATSVESTPGDVAAWVASLVDAGVDVRFVAMDNEPELWGYTHYDVHPQCTTYAEVLDTYLEYASAVRDVAPGAELLGPVMCCWYDFWDPDDAPDGGFLHWFLSEVRAADEAAGRRTIDVVDVHYYPQSDVFNDDTDPATSARRLRSTRSLWDPAYADESWIGAPIRLIPRLRETIAESYPGLPLAITEWNFGADWSMNGAVAIADVLAIFGREGVYAAAYWRSPPPLSPGYFAFVMHGNYDGSGSAFVGDALRTESTNNSLLSAFAAIDDDAGVVRVMLINKHPSTLLDIDLTIAGATLAGDVRRFAYGSADPEQVIGDIVVDLAGPLAVAPYTVVVLEATVDGVD